MPSRSRDVAGSSYLSSEDPRVHFGLGTRHGQRAHRPLPERRRDPPEPGFAANRGDLCPCARGRGGLRGVCRTSTDAPSRGSGTRRCSTQSAVTRPAPTTHARNLFHVSAAMWDAWAAYDRTAVGYFSREKQASVKNGSRRGRRRSATPPTAFCSGATRRATALQTTFDEFADDDDLALLQPSFREHEGQLTRRHSATASRRACIDGGRTTVPGAQRLRGSELSSP